MLSLAHATTTGTIDAAGTGTIFINGGALELAISGTGTLNNGIVINGTPATIEATAATTAILEGTFTDHVNAGTLLIGSQTDTGTIVFAPSSVMANPLSLIEVAGGTLQAGANNSELSRLTASAQTTKIDANATLDFNGNSGANATIANLQGAGTLSNSSGATTVIGAGNFSGTITGAGNVEVSTGTLTLSGTSNNYTGSTTVDGGTTLALTGAASILASSGLIDNGTFDIGGNSATSIAGLSGNSTGIVALGSNTLTITGGGSFAGAVNGAGGVTLALLIHQK